MAIYKRVLEAVLLLFTAVSYILIFHGYLLMDIIDRILVKLELKIVGKFNCVPADAETEIQVRKSRASWQLKKDNVGVFAIQGRRNLMEDRFNVVSNLDLSGSSLYGVFDGHGGEFAAEFAEKTLFKLVMAHLLRDTVPCSASLCSMLSEVMLAVDQQLLDVSKLIGDQSGTTALLVLHHQNKLFVANVGDSRGIMCDHRGNVTPLSVDHKPHQATERRRIRKAGGYVSFNGVWRVSGVLATSRALGDFPMKDRGLIISDPDIRVFDLGDLMPSFIILASDGLWDVFSNEEACAYIRERLNEPHFGAKSIVLQAYYRGSLDNITAMVIHFGQT